MPKQIDVKVTKLQNKHGQGTTRKCPIAKYSRPSNFLPLILHSYAKNPLRDKISRQPRLS